MSILEGFARADERDGARPPQEAADEEALDRGAPREPDAADSAEPARRGQQREPRGYMHEGYFYYGA